ncbi:MAG: tRNA lysidine(34) synthetase TilS [Chloroflexales bacterium]
MDDSLLTRVHRFLTTQGLFRPDALLVVAVSGGPDSLCLLHMLASLARSSGPQLHVAHLDHGFRGAQSAAEARAVADTATAWAMPATLAYADVPALARASGEGSQAAARRARYAFFSEVARAVAAHAVAVAHTADDQAETVLLHALRGAGPAGLRGMRPVVAWDEWAFQEVGGRRQEAGGGGRGERLLSPASCLLPPLIRPLLETTRAEIMAYCAQNHLDPAEDPSNSSPRYARSRVRHQLLPALATHNPQVVAALGRTAQICADDYAFMQVALDAVWPALVIEVSGGLELGLEAWQSLHPALRRYALRRAAAHLGTAELSFAQVEAGRTAIDSRRKGRGSLAHGLLLDVGSTHASIRTLGAPESTESPQLATDTLLITTPGRTPLGGGWVCIVQREPPAETSPWWVAIPAELASRLALRVRRPGDRFRPAGGRGGRRLQDFFVDRKFPQRLRDAWPILVADEEILWVAGLRAAERACISGTGDDVFWIGIGREEEQQDHAH